EVYFREPLPSFWLDAAKLVAGALAFLAVAWGVALFFREVVPLDSVIAWVQFSLGASRGVAVAAGFAVALAFFAAGWRGWRALRRWRFRARRGSLDEMAGRFWRSG